MDRRKAFATAGALSATALPATIALGANVGLFGLSQHDSGPGNFKVVDAGQTPNPLARVEIVDVPVPSNGDAGTAGARTEDHGSHDDEAHEHGSESEHEEDD